MATTVARAEVQLDIDGDRLPTQIRRAAAGAGRGAGLAFTKEFNKGLSKWSSNLVKEMDKAGKLGTERFEQRVKRLLKGDLNKLGDQLARALTSQRGFDDLVKEFGSVDAAVEHVNDGLHRMIDAGELNKKRWRETRDELDQWITSARKAEAEANAIADATERDAEQAELATRKREAFRTENDRLARSLQDVRLALSSKDNWDTLIKGSDDSSAAIKRLEGNLFDLRTAGKVSEDQFTVLRERMRGYANAGDEVIATNEKIVKSHDNHGRSLGRVGSAWRRLDGTVKLVLATIAFGSAEVATLGSAAGAGITVLASSLGPLIVAGGSAIAILAGLNDKIEDLPKAFQATKVSFDGFTSELGKLQDAMQTAAAPGFTAAFTQLQTIVIAITPALEAVSAAVGEVARNFTERLMPGTQGLDNLTKLLRAAVPVFASLSDAAFTFGEAFGNIFVASIPFVQRFADWLGQIADKFLAWTSSLEGQNTLEAWFDSAFTVLTAVGPLIEAVAGALADLVTPETVAQTVEFLGTLTEFIPLFGNILAALGDMQVLNLLAELLLAVGTALQPLLPAFSEMAGILVTSVIYAIETLVPPLTDLIIAIAPLLPIIAELAAVALNLALTALVPLIEAVAELIPMFTPLLESLIPLIPEFTLLAKAIGDLLVQALQVLAPILPPLISLFITLIAAIQPMLPLITVLVQMGINILLTVLKALASIIGIVIGAFDAIIRPIVNAGTQIYKITDSFNTFNDVVESSGSFFRDWGDTIADVVGNVVGWVSDAANAIGELLGLQASARSGSSGGGGGFAAGGVVSGPAYRLTGEAGPEAIVPLNRPLSMVSPEVRWLSAIAQGQGMPGGGRGGGGVVIEAGAVQVNGVLDPQRASLLVVNRLAERIVG